LLRLKVVVSPKLLWANGTLENGEKKLHQSWERVLGKITTS